MGVVAKLGGAAGGYAGRVAGGAIGGKIYGKKGRQMGQKYGGQLGKSLGSGLAKKIPIIGSFKKGGRVKRTGAYLLHKGEHVIPVRKKKRKIVN